jgi:hypothetical protein
MREVPTYVCEICGEAYSLREDALRCEANGLPEPMPFLPFGVEVPVFGEDGINHAVVSDVQIRNHMGHSHEWWLYAVPQPFVSHNLSYDISRGWTPAEAFDPRKGYDAFRYQCSDSDFDVWMKTLKAYGFKPEDAEPYIREHVRAYVEM